MSITERDLVAARVELTTASSLGEAVNLAEHLHRARERAWSSTGAPRAADLMRAVLGRLVAPGDR